MKTTNVPAGIDSGVRWLLVCLVILCASPCYAASLYTETFDGTLGGWQDRDAGKMSVTNSVGGGNPGGCLRGRFNLQDPVFPQDDAMIATGALASASFIGNYDEVDAWMIGFDFMASNIVPSSLRLSLVSGSSSGTNIIDRFLASFVTTTTNWYSFRIPLLAANLGGWTGDIGAFDSIKTNITRVEFEIVRNSTPQQTYYLDNIFLDRVPDAVEFSSNGMGGTAITWLSLRSGLQYRVEGSVDLVQPQWTLVESFIATSSVYQAVYPVTNNFNVYRMLMP